MVFVRARRYFFFRYPFAVAGNGFIASVGAMLLSVYWLLTVYAMTVQTITM